MLPAMGNRTATVTVYRGRVAESTHRVHAAVVRADGGLVAWTGDPDRLTTLRSSAKPYQAEPVIASGAVDEWELDQRVVAVMCASHSGTDAHVQAVRRGLEAAGVPPDALRNTSGDVEERLRHNCSGNHLAFLSLSAFRGWPLERYRDPVHPSQRAALEVVAAAAGTDPEQVATCTDGCGVVAFALPLQVAAGMYARIAEELPRQADAMRAHPEMVAGDGRLDTELMRAVPGVVSKGGAEAIGCCGLPDGTGVAVRVEDGNHRALEPAVMAVLTSLLGWQHPPAGLEQFDAPELRNSPGDVVGQIRADVSLETRA